MRNVFKAPLQSLSQLTRAVGKIRQGLVLALQTKDEIKESLRLLGQRQFWMQLGEEFDLLWNDLKEAYGNVSSLLTRRVNAVIESSSGDISRERQEELIIKRMKEILNGVFKPLEALKNLSAPFLDAYNAVIDVINQVKEAFTTLKEKYESVKSLVVKVFGPKFHKKFPRKRRPCSGGVCSCGGFPSTGGGRFDEGVDVLIAENAKVVSPVGGRAKSSGTGQVTITPGEGSFSGKRIIIYDMTANSSLSNSQEVFAGQVIGTAARSSCQPNAIHVTVKEPSSSGDLAPVDPTPFIDRIELPDLTWHQVCDEYKLVLLGFTLSSGKLSEAVKQAVSDIKRGQNPFEGVGDKVKDVVNKANDAVANTVDKAKEDLKELKKQVDTAVDDVTDAFTSSGVQKAFKEVFPKPGLDIPEYTGPDFGPHSGKGFDSFGDFFRDLKSNFVNYDPKQLTVGSTLDLFTRSGMVNEVNSLQELVNSLKSAIDNPHCQTPATTSDKKLRSLLRLQGKLTTGIRYELIQRLNEIPDTACSGIRSALQRVSGQYCTVDADCLGFSCCTPLRVVFWRKFLKARARLDPCLGVLTLSLGSWARTFNVSTAFEETVTVGGDVFGDGLSITMSVNALRDAATVNVSTTVRLCSRLLRTCVPSFPILHEAIFSLTASDCNSQSPTNDPTLSVIKSMTLDDFQEEMADAGVKGFVTTMVAMARGALLENLLNNVGLVLSDPLGEFKKRVDFCQSASWDYPPVSKQFFEYQTEIPMGPVIVHLFFGARGAYGSRFDLGICILSSEATVAVIPWAGIEIYGGVRVGIFIFFVEVSIHGHILQVQFPAKASVGYAQMPLDVKGTVDVNLVPLKLSIRAAVLLYIRICFWKCITFRKTIWSSELWSYTSPTISKNVLTIGKDDEDESAPQFRSLTYDGNRKRRSAGTVPCAVHQLPNRFPSTPSFQIEVAAYDDESEVSYQLDIGTYSGGLNVKAQFDMGGPQLLSTDQLPSGRPLYFTVKASNSQGKSSRTMCSIPTYDTTPPGGRVEESYDISSHPFSLSALLVFHDDSPLRDMGRASVGLGSGKANVIGTYAFSFQGVGVNNAATNDLEHFALPRLGRLTAPAVATTSAISPLQCATFCLSYNVQCVSFDYNYHTDLCVVLQAIEGPLVKRQVSGSFHNFERIGVGYTAWFKHTNMTLNHGETYYFNAELTNELGYTQLMSSKGTLVDFSPPFPGELGDAKYDVTVASQCSASFLQRCSEVTPWPNHRIVIDGEGGQTVFNGHEPFADLLYTRYNNFIACNFQGFHDDESGIYKYAWSGGTEPLETDVFKYEDPHAHLHDERHWTHSGTKLLDLQDGHYFLTVQVVNNVVFGGSLVVDVAHSTPYIIDTVPPQVHYVHGLDYNEDTQILQLQYNTSDATSGVREIDFALGRTIHDTDLHSWDRHGNLTMLWVRISVLEGVPAWVRIRAIDNVYLMAVGHSHHPLVIDRSAPVIGYVYDGRRHGYDVAFTAVNDTICINWDNFHDEESGIGRYAQVGVGSRPGLTDVVPLKKVIYKAKEICVKASLLHAHFYYSTLVVYNQGHDKLSVNHSSDGVLVDLTNPVAGWVKDGLDPTENVDFSYVDSAAYCNWNGFYDPESNVAGYEVQSFISGVPGFLRSVGLVTSSTDTSVVLQHGDTVRSVVTAIDGADRRTSIATDGYIIDKSPPLLISIGFEGSRAGIPFFQADMTMIKATWAYEDPESGIKSYRVAVHEFHHGNTQPIYPSQGDWADFPKQGKDGTINMLVVSNLALRSGAEYVVKVTATNQAKLAVIHTSEPMIVDSTPPAVAWLVVGNLDGSEEELDDLGRIVHSDQNGIEASWYGSDPESGVDTYLVAVGTSIGGSQVSGGWRDVGSRTSAYIDHIALSLSDSSSGQPVYYVTVKARNKAGLESQGVSSKPVFVVRADVAGAVLDGADVLDAEFQRQSLAVTAQFTPFSSERCGGIVKHEWGIGTQALEDDLQPFTSVAIVVRNDGSGFAQMPVYLQNGQKIYSTIKATTGCGNELISSSSGVTADITAPYIKFTNLATVEAANISTASSFYVYSAGSVGAAWKSRDEESGVEISRWAASSLPTDLHRGNVITTLNTQTTTGDLPQQPEGVPNFIWAEAENHVSYRQSITSNGIVVDSSPPSLGKVDCPKAVSQVVSELSCCWEGINDPESGLINFNVSMAQSDGAIVTSVSVQQADSPCCSLPLNNDYLVSGSYLISVEAVNGVHLSSFTYAKVTVDTSPPVAGRVRHISDEYQLDLEGNSTVDSLLLCQSSETDIYITWDQFVDTETPIDRYEVGVGDYPGSTSLRGFESVGLATSTRVRHLQLQHGSTAYVSIRGVNSVELSSISVSDGVVINTKLGLAVRDGLEEDLDFQASSSVISASWIHNGACPITSLSWAIYRIDGVLLRPFVDIPVQSSMAVTEEISLLSGERYNAVVRLENALGEVVIARSDGVTVDIEPPVPGQVFDGPELGVDLNYQASVTTLSATWMGFGLANSQAPGQQIAKYEVALGSDDRFPVTRRNIVPFKEVDLNTSVTFEGLDLIPQAQQYFFTVRAYGLTGASVEVTSNGISVGFGDPVLPGSVTVKRFSNTSSSLTASWDGFSSHVPILFFEWGVSSTLGNVSQCPQSVNQYLRNVAVDHIFDVQNFVDIGLDTVATSNNLSLSHNRTYYVTVRATNAALRCVSTHSQAILVDLTPPHPGIITVGLETNLGASYIQEVDEVRVTWRDFSDPESGISEYKVALISRDSCSESSEASAFNVVAEYISVGNDTSYVFHSLALDSSKPYFVSVVAINGAGSSRVALSKPILVDVTSPFVGDLKDGKDWKNDRVFQSAQNALQATASVAYTESQLSCPNRDYNMKSVSALTDWKVYSGDSVGNIPNYGTIIFESRQVRTDRDGLKIGWVRDRGTSRLLSGAVYASAGRLEDSSFVVEMKTAMGKASLTSVVLWNGAKNTIGDFETPGMVRDEANATYNQLNTSDNSASGSGSGAESVTLQPDLAKSIRNESDQVDSKMGELQYVAASASVGFQVWAESELSEIGLDQRDFYLLFWCRFSNDEQTAKSQWVALGFDPSGDYHTYRIATRRQQTEGSLEWMAELYVDDNLKAVLNGIPEMSDENSSFSVAVRTYRGYVPPLSDPFNPPSAFARIRRVTLPAVASNPCHYGQSLGDLESPIVSIEACVSSQPTGVCDVVPFQKKEPLCVACRTPCDRYSCSSDCKSKEVSIHSFELVNLTLPRGTVSPIADGLTTMSSVFRPASYYFVLKLMNAAGGESVSVSNGVVIDTTGANCSAVHQVDPSWSLTEPALYQGTNTSIAAFWQCNDNISGIVQYSWAIGTNKTSHDIQHYTAIGLASSMLRDGLSLSQKTTYYVSIRIENGAQLYSTWHGDGITVDVEAPEISNITVAIMFSEKWLNHSNTERTSSGDRLGIKWSTIADVDVGEIEWAVGFEENGTQILPLVTVSIGGNASYAQVIDGKILVGRDEMLNLSDVGALQRQTFQDEMSGRSFLNVEPGRVIYHTLTVHSRAHKSSIVSGPRAAFLRSHDVAVLGSTVSNQTEHTVLLPLGEEPAENRRVTLNLAVSTDGGAVVGSLLQEDLTTEYGSSAVIDYEPYIQNPEQTRRETSRRLTSRFHKFLGTSFFVSPIQPGDITGPITLRVPFNATISWGDEVPEILFWDPGLRVWRIASYNSCPTPTSIDWREGILSVRVCSTWKSTTADRQRRSKSEATYLQQPTQFALASIGKQFVNTAPTIPSPDLHLTMDEDNRLSVHLTYSDDEDDIARFDLEDDRSLQLGVISLSEDGVLEFVPCSNCYGSVIIGYTITEINLPEGQPLSAVGRIHITVEPKQDPPILYYIPLETNESRIANDVSSIYFVTEQSKQSPTSFSLPVAILDPDGSDRLSVRINAPSDGNVSVYETSPVSSVTSPFEPILMSATQIPPPAFKEFVVEYILQANYSGMAKIEMVAHDQNSSYSNVLTVNVYVLKMPCQNGGHCAGNTSDPLCRSLERAFSFETYFCLCEAGYSGRLCQTDIDECATQPCGVGYTCEDLVNGYSCVATRTGGSSAALNPYEIAGICVAVTVAVLVAAVLVGVLVARKKKKLKQRQNGQDRLDIGPPKDSTESPQFHNSSMNETMDCAVPLDIIASKEDEAGVPNADGERITSFVRGREASDTELRDTIASKGSTAGVPNVGKEITTFNENEHSEADRSLAKRHEPVYDTPKSSRKTEECSQRQETSPGQNTEAVYETPSSNRKIEEYSERQDTSLGQNITASCDTSSSSRKGQESTPDDNTEPVYEHIPTESQAYVFVSNPLYDRVNLT